MHLAKSLPDLGDVPSETGTPEGSRIPRAVNFVQCAVQAVKLDLVAIKLSFYASHFSQPGLRVALRDQ